MKSHLRNQTQFSRDQHAHLIAFGHQLEGSPERAELKEHLRNAKTVVRDDLINTLDRFGRDQSFEIADSTHRLFDKIDPRKGGLLSDTSKWIHSGTLHHHDLATLKATEALSKTSSATDDILTKALRSSGGVHDVSTASLMKMAQALDASADGFIAAMKLRQDEVSVFDAPANSRNGHSDQPLNGATVLEAQPKTRTSHRKRAGFPSKTHAVADASHRPRSSRAR
jgi:hypothetical protein